MLRTLSGLLLALLFLTACSASKAPAPAADSTAPTGSPKKVSLVLDWYPNAVHAFVFAAEQQGYFQAEGLEVEIKMPAENPTDGIKLVGAGRESFAFYYQPDVLLARGEQIPIVSVAAVVRRPLNGIMVPAGGPVKSPKDLEGRVVGYPGIPLNVNMVRTMVRAAGGDPDKVSMQDISWDLIPAILTGKVPAIAGGYLNHEKPLLEREGVGITYFAPTDYGVPNYYELVLITGEETARRERATVEAFWRALARGHQWVKEHREEALTLLLARQNKNFPLEEQIERQSLEILLPRMEEPGVAFGAQRAEDWERVARWMRAEGVLKAAVDAADAFVPLVKQP
ncbi:MAG: ABC transporter substrate-binding protein [Bacillota bacterium]